MCVNGMLSVCVPNELWYDILEKVCTMYLADGDVASVLMLYRVDKRTRDTVKVNRKIQAYIDGLYRFTMAFERSEPIVSLTVNTILNDLVFKSYLLLSNGPCSSNLGNTFTWGKYKVEYIVQDATLSTWNRVPGPTYRALPGRIEAAKLPSQTSTLFWVTVPQTVEKSFSLCVLYYYLVRRMNCLNFFIVSDQAILNDAALYYKKMCGAKRFLLCGKTITV